jgi:putative radical SAM enzyme (TIGR03279 family)
MVRVSHVASSSIAEELGIVPGAELVAIDGRPLDDFLDWEFLSADERIELEVKHPSGESVLYDVERDLSEPFGVQLEPPTVRRCANRCEFCFIEGLPKGLRKPLYIRDDDYRLSFAYGNFATLSNLKERDYERILTYRLSPLYVSVHATPWDVRKTLLNNPRVPNVIEQLTRLAAGGIRFHCQMVIVPGLNDGAVLEQSLNDLWALGDAVMSVAVVPVGLTQFSHLYSGKPMSREHAAALLTAAERWDARAQRERGGNWVFGSDELYLLAQRPLPPAEFYGEFSQIENGVGAVAFLRQRIAAGLGDFPELHGARILVVSGTAMRDIMSDLLRQIGERTGAHFELVPVVNSLFGPTTTTAGLLVGADIRTALAARADADLALIPAECINEDGVFLDDDTLQRVRGECAIPIVPSYDFLDALSGDGEGLAVLQPHVRAA